jgi:hypothetical protein
VKKLDTCALAGEAAEKMADTANDKMMIARCTVDSPQGDESLLPRTTIESSQNARPLPSKKNNDLPKKNPGREIGRGVIQLTDGMRT